MLIDVRGVGYLVTCSERTLAALPAPGEAVALYTELLVREDVLQLFGFLSLAEKEWHRLLTDLPATGPRAEPPLDADDSARDAALVAALVADSEHGRALQVVRGRSQLAGGPEAADT